MAENELIGGIAVEIVGDYSQLRADIDTATQMAAAGGAEIAEALTTGAAGADLLSGSMTAAATAAQSFEDQIAELVNSGSTLAEALAAVGTGAEAITEEVAGAGSAAAAAAEQMSLFDEAVTIPFADAAGQLNLFSDQLEPIPAAATAAAAATEKLGEAEEGAGEGAKHAGDSVQTFSEKLIALGEAVAVVAGLRALGLAALEAADAVDDASRAIGMLGKGAGESEAAVAKLRTLASDDALSFPELLKAATRMTAFLGSAEQVPGIMAAVGDSAAVMGTSIEASSRSFERLVSGGDLSKRSLLALGLTLGDMAKALGTTEEKAKEAFAALDQAGKIEALEKGLSKFAGAAKALSDDALGAMVRMGQAWHEVLEGIGTALDPVIKQMAEFANTEILPFLKDVVAGFNNLSPAVKETVLVVAALAAAFVPVTLAVGAAGLAVGAFTSAIAPVTAGLVSMGAGLTGAGASYTAMLATGIASATIWLGLAVAIADVVVAYTSMTRAQDLAASTQVRAAASLAEYEVRLKRHGIDISELQKQYAAGAMSTDDYIRALGKLRDEFLKTHPVVQEHAAAVTGAASASDSFKIKMQALSEAVTSTRDHLAAVTQKFNEHKATSQDVAKAYDAWQGATAALNSAHTAFLPVVTNVHHATKAFVDETRDFPGAAQASANAADALAIKIGAEALALAEAQRWLDIVLKKYAEHNATAKQVAAAFDLVQSSAAALAKTSVDLPTVGLQKYLDTLFAAAGGWKKMEEAALRALPALERPNASFRDTSSILADMGIHMDEVHNIFANKLLKDYEDLQKKNHTIEEEAAAWGKVSGSLDKLAKTDLPLVLRMYDQHYAQQVKAGEAEGDLLETMGKRLQLQIQIAEQTGASATSQIISLETVRLKQQALHDSTAALGEMVVGIERDIEKGWKLVGDALVDDILEGQNFVKSMEDVGKQVSKMIMTELVGYAFKELKTSIIGVGKEISNVKDNWTALNKAINDAVGGGVQSGADAAKGAAGGFGKGGGSMIDTIASVGTLISSIVANVQFAHMNESLKVVVQHTLHAANELTNMRADLWAQFDLMYERAGEIWRDMRDGFQALVDGVGIGTGQAAQDAAETRSLFKGALHDLTGAVREAGRSGRGGDGSPAASSDTPWNPFTGIQGDIWAGLTRPNAMPGSPAASTYSSANLSNSVGDVQFNIYGATDPRQTAREVTQTLKILSPRFAAYSQ